MTPILRSLLGQVTRLLVFLLLLLQAAPARAHADLLQATPAANAQLGQSPAQVELIFSEPLEAAFSTVEVLDDQGRRVDAGDVQVRTDDPTRMTVSLRSLNSGVFTVTWRAYSSTDGHITSGAYAFAVGAATVDPALVVSGAQVSLQPAEVLARWLRYVGLAILIGALAFGLRLTPTALGTGWRTAAQVAVSLFLLAQLIGFLAQVGKADDLPIGLPWTPAAFQTLTGTRFGLMWTMQTAAAVLLAVGTQARVWPRAAWVSLGLSLILGALTAAGGHSAALSDGGVGLLAAVLHIWGAALWVGGLGALFALLARNRETGERRWGVDRPAPAGLPAASLVVLMRAFTPLAIVGVLTLSGSGVYAAWQFVGSWDLLRATPYGGALLGKLLLATVMLAFGAWHSWLARVPTDRPVVPGTGRLETVARTVRVETGLGFAVLLLAAILTVLPTAYTAPAEVRASQTSDDLSLTLRVSPGRVGMNDYVLTVTDATGPLAAARSVRLRFTAMSGRVPSSELQLAGRGDGTYTARSADLGVADTWQLQTIIRREGKFDTFANFNLALDQRAAATRWLPWTSAALIGLALVLAIALWVLWPGGVQRRVGRPAALSGAAAVLVLSIYWLAQPAPVDANSLLNPIPTGPASTAAGRVLYEANCLVCHGPEGAGDGPVGLTLNPRPADLRAHAVPGVHSDGQLYLWITGGFPGSVMPAFADTLTDEERWHLVNYLRTLAP